MRFRPALSRTALAVVVVAVSAIPAAAQSGRVFGVVRDIAGQTIKGATVRAENPGATPASFTASTDDKGRFAVLGLASGTWEVTAEALGYTPDKLTVRVQAMSSGPPLAFTLKKIIDATPLGVLGGVRTADLQIELAAADELYNGGQWDQAIAAYKTILAKVPALSVISLQIGSAYRNKKDYDGALAAYNQLLKVDPANEKALAGISATNLERGDLKNAEDSLKKAVDAPDPGREVLYAFGDVKRAQGEAGEAAKYYQRAADLDPTWGKPWYKLGLLAMDRGDKDGAAKLMERVIAVDPMSAEAIQAKTVIEQIKK